MFKRLSDRVDRIGQLLEGTHIDAKVLVVDPHSGVPDKSGVNLRKHLAGACQEPH